MSSEASENEDKPTSNIDLRVYSVFVLTFVNSDLKYRKIFQIEHIKLNISYEFINSIYKSK